MRVRRNQAICEPFSVETRKRTIFIFCAIVREIWHKICVYQKKAVSLHSQTKNNATMTKKKQSGSDQPQIKFDAHNFRYHNDKNKKMIHDSLSELGAGRSIVMDNQNELIAGNGVYEQAQKLGMPVRIVETDGTELVVVKRTDLATDDMKRKKLAAADNAISDHVEWNAEELRLSGLDDLTLQELNIELPEIGGGDRGKRSTRGQLRRRTGNHRNTMQAGRFVAIGQPSPDGG